MKKTFLLTAFLLLLTAGMKAQCSVTFTYSASPANNGSVNFVDSSNLNAFLASYYWNFGDGSTGYGPNPVHTYPASGTFYTCLTGSDSMGCTVSFCDSVVVINNSPTCHAQFYYYADSSGSYNLMDQSSGYALTYSWNYGDGTTGTTAGTQNHVFPGPGTYNVCLTVTNGPGTCTDSYCDTVFVSNCHSSFSYAFDPLGNGCTFTSTVSGTTDTYAWDFGDGSTSSLANPYHVYAANGSYSVSLVTSSSTDSTCSDSHYTYLYANGICDANFYIAQDSSNLFNYFIYNYTYGNSNANYFWDFGDGTTSTVQYPTHTFPSASSYYVCLTVSDSTGCSSTHCDTLNPGHGGGVISVTVVPPATTTGIHESAAASTTFDSYPNPFSETNTVSYSIAQDASIVLNLYDILGNKIIEIEKDKKAAGNYSTQWSAGNIAPGMYMLQLNVNNKITTKKVIISK